MSTLAAVSRPLLQKGFAAQCGAVKKVSPETATGAYSPLDCVPSEPCYVWVTLWGSPQRELAYFSRGTFLAIQSGVMFKQSNMVSWRYGVDHAEP